MATNDAIRILRDDHEKMKDFFQAFHDTDGDRLEEKELLVYELLSLVYVHFQVNELVLYPEIGRIVRDDPMMDYARGLQNEALSLMSQIEALPADDPAWEGLVMELEDAVEEHIRDEESEICYRFQDTSEDFSELGRKVAEKREELLNEEQGWRKTA